MYLRLPDAKKVTNVTGIIYDLAGKGHVLLIDGSGYRGYVRTSDVDVKRPTDDEDGLITFTYRRATEEELYRLTTGKRLDTTPTTPDNKSEAAD